MATTPPTSGSPPSATAAPLQSGRSVLVDLALVAAIVFLAARNVDAREAWYLLGIMVMARFSIGASKLYLYRANPPPLGPPPGGTE